MEPHDAYEEEEPKGDLGGANPALVVMVTFNLGQELVRKGSSIMDKDDPNIRLIIKVNALSMVPPKL
jgi:hypothetical protein